jgi:acyl-CoA synthetase (NDP forming)
MAAVKDTLSLTALNEAQSKAFLKPYGIPVVEEQIARSANEALSAAQALGYPVVIKGVGSTLAHKTERGLVILNVKRADEVHDAVETLTTNGGDELEGFLVQAQMTGTREFVAGVFTDACFGPVIMFGIGGVITEALNDVSFALPPVSEADIEDMLGELSTGKLLEAFRGEAPVDRQQIKQILLGLSELCRDHPEIREVDINPLLADPDGRLVAVDALVVKADGRSHPTQPALKKRPPIDPFQLGALFYPQSIAFVGASGDINKWGFWMFSNTMSGGYNGRIHLINRNGKTICGQQTLRSVADIDGPVDLAVVTIPADQVVDLIPALEKKRAKGMLVVTSGYRETGEHGRQLEEELVRAARKAGILLLGPNTMGICNPSHYLYCFSTHTHTLPGSATLVSQSGNMGAQLLSFAEQQGIGIRAFSGSGNEAMVTIEDYMELFERDKLSRTVLLYLESVKDGRRFFNSAQQVSKIKPIVVLKGGRTEVGGQAALSHSGAMASDIKVFDAACRQAGIIQVKNTMDLLDLSAVLSSLPLPKGNRAAIVTLGGGWGVVTADQCAEHGLSLPELPLDLIRKFDDLLPNFWSRANPIDLVGSVNYDIPLEVIASLLKWDGCDAVIHLGVHGLSATVEKIAESVSAICTSDYSAADLEAITGSIENQERDYVDRIAGLTDQYEKPIVGVGLVTDSRSRTLYRVADCKFKGVFFPSPERAVKALAGMYRYQKWLDR